MIDEYLKGFLLMKKIMSLFMIFAVVLTLASCQTAEEKQNEVVEMKPLVVVITDEGGIGDHSFNDEALASIEAVQEEEDIDIRFFEAPSKDKYIETIQTAVNEDATLTVAVGSNMQDAVLSVAASNPDSHFAVIDSQVKSTNVSSMSFADNESAFLAGYAAAKTTKTGKVGLLGGDERATVDLFGYGYEAGAKAANPNVQVVRGYIGSFYDSDKGYDAAVNMFKNENTDVIMHVAGPSGTGVIKAAKDNGFTVIGADKDQSSLASDNVLCSATKNMKPGLEEFIKAALKDNFEGVHVTYYMKDDGVNLSDNAGNIKGELKEQIDALKKAIKDGDLTVPADKESLQSFTIPEGIL